jgi:hypothetical protein
MLTITSVQRGITILSILATLPAIVWVQANEGPVRNLEILWEFDAGG